MVAFCLPDRVSVRFVVALAAAVVACSPGDSAQAFNFFGLWGSDESPPPVSRTTISYAVTIDVAGGDSGLKNGVMDASSVYKLRTDAPPDGDALARRAQSDFGPIIDAMWGAGYYDATVTISIGSRQPQHPVRRHRGLCARRGKLPQPRRRSRIHHRRPRAAVPSALDPRAWAQRRGAFGSGAARADRPPQARRLRGVRRPARGAGPDRRLFPQTRAPVRQGRLDRSRSSITPRI